MKKLLYILIILTLSFAQSQAQKVGINTTTPQQELDVNGSFNVEDKLFIRDSNLVNPGDTIRLAAVDTDGEVHKLDEQLVNYVSFCLHNVNGDYIRDYNTRIPSDRYNLMVVGSSFDLPIRVRNILRLKSILAFEQDGFWRLRVDYHRVRPVQLGEWIINCIAVPTAVSQILPNQTINLNEQSNGTALNSPL